jgi:hypothetical protein
MCKFFVLYSTNLQILIKFVYLKSCDGLEILKQN